MLRLIHLLRNPRAAIDLASVMVGVIVVALVTGAISATVFAVIPWAQNEAAKHDLGAVKQAESVAKLPDPAKPNLGKYLPKPRDLSVSGADPINLVSEQLMPDKLSISVGLDTARSCYIGVSQSPTGKFYWLDSVTPVVHDWDTDKTSACDAGLAALIADFPQLSAKTPFTELASYTPPLAGTWSSSAVTPDGKTMIAARATGSIFTSTDAGSTWVERTDAGSKSWNSVAVAPDGKHMLAAAAGEYLYTSSNGGANWTKVTAQGTHAWYKVTIADDGNALAVAAGEDSFTSTDFGGTWLRDPGTGSWSSSAVAPDGKTMIAARATGSIFTSTDAGSTWVERTDAGSKSWNSVAVAPDGKHMLAAAAGEYLYTSSNGGANWTKVTAQGTHAWYKVTIADDGNALAVAAGEDSFTSTDFGETWLKDPGAQSWANAATSRDGTTLLAAPATGAVTMSRNSGENWSTVTDLGTTKSWQGVAVSGDGSVLFAAEAGGDIFRSTNSGASWSATTAGQKIWRSVSVSKDGRTVVATVGNGTVWMSANGGDTWSPATFPAGATGAQTWTYSGISNDGQSIIVGAASSSVGAWATTNGGTTWTKLATNSNVSSVTVSGNGNRFFYSDYNGFYGRTGVTGTDIPFTTGTHYVKLATNIDGSIIGYGGSSGIAWVPFDGTAFGAFSTDANAYSMTFTSVNAADDGSVVATASTGQVMIATRKPGVVFDDSGAGFTRYVGVPRGTSVPGVDTSDDGRTVVVGSYEGLLISKDSGHTWIRKYSSANVGGVAVSGDGKRFFLVDHQTIRAYGSLTTATAAANGSTLPTKSMIAANIDGTLVGYGSSYGVGWTTFDGTTLTVSVVDTNNYTNAFTSMSAADDGSVVATTSTQVVVASRKPGVVFDDSGAGYTRYVGVPRGTSIPAVDTSDDGRTVAIGSYEGLLISKDSGHTWIRKYSSANIGGVAVSGDGKRFFTVDHQTIRAYGALTASQVPNASTLPTKSMIAANIDGTIVGYGSSYGVGWTTFDGAAFTAPVTDTNNYTNAFTSMSAADDGSVVATTSGTTGQILVANRKPGVVLDDSGAGYTRYTTIPSGTGRNTTDASDDGLTVAASSTEGFFVSKDFGHTWIRRYASANIGGVAISGDGSRIFLTDFQTLCVHTTLASRVCSSETLSNYSKITTNYEGSFVIAARSNIVKFGFNGTAFAASTSQATASAPAAFASSDDGTVQAAAVSGKGMTSADGAAWVSPATLTGVPAGVAIAGNGSAVYAAVSGKNLQVSKDRGATFTLTSSPSITWSGVAVSKDGSKIAGVAINGDVVTSVDGGQSWKTTNFPGIPWHAVTTSSDGAHILAMMNTGQVYTLDWNR